jgi:hypothetical protein
MLHRGLTALVDTDGTGGGRPQAVTIESEKLVVRAVLADGQPEVLLGVADGHWVLRRTEASGRELADGVVGWEPLWWDLEVREDGEASTVALVGRTDDIEQFIGLTLRAPGDWLEVTEAMSAPSGRLSGLLAFQSRWRFSGGGAVREVFTPSLVPEEGDLVGRHMLRSPVAVVESAEMGAVLAVDIDVLSQVGVLPAALGLERLAGDEVDLLVGLRAQEVRDHVFHRARAGGAEVGAAPVWHRYRLACVPTPRPGASLAAARRTVWAGAGARGAGRPLPQSAQAYARQIFPGALSRLWAETVLAGRRAGAITANRSYAGDVWFSSWFNPLRSSYGLFHYGQVLGRDDWVEMARATRALLLSAPSAGGLFPTVFVFGPDRWVDSHHQGGGPGVFHLMDMSWTMYQLLRWHEDLEADEESLAVARSYAQALAGLQRPDGGLAAYVDRDGAPVTVVSRAGLLLDLKESGGDPYVPGMVESHWGEARFVESAEDAASLLFLASLARLLPASDRARGEILATARGIARYLAEKVFPSARWTDFEVYFSCSPKSLDFYDRRSGQWPQNTLCLQHGAAGLLELYQVTGDPEHLELAGRAMDRLSLYQQVWSPPWLGLFAFGGYGVMNTDGEWNDARQAQFAETHLAFSRATGETEHRERAVAAARAAFTTVFLPVSASRYSGWWRAPQGMAAENHGHGGADQLNGVSGFDWGSGSALATAAYFERHGLPL